MTCDIKAFIFIVLLCFDCAVCGFNVVVQSEALRWKFKYFAQESDALSMEIAHRSMSALELASFLFRCGLTLAISSVN